MRPEVFTMPASNDPYLEYQRDLLLRALRRARRQKRRAPKEPPPEKPKCCAPDCTRDACFIVYLYDIYPYYDGNADIFCQRDYTCPYLCDQHMAENEEKARGTREPRGFMQYPYTNRNRANGFTIYRWLRLR
jgi:hypothetical protein